MTKQLHPLWSVLTRIIAVESDTGLHFLGPPDFLHDNYHYFESYIDNTQHRQISPSASNAWTAVAFCKAPKDSRGDLYIAPDSSRCDQRDDRKRHASSL